MKKCSMTLMGIFVILLLAACNDNEEPDELSDPSNTEQEEVNNEEITNSDDHTEEEMDDGEEEEEQADEIVQEEEPDPEPEPETAQPLYELSESWNLVPLNDQVNEQVVLLTIDDGPDEHTLEMAKTLKELEAPAIFFVNGHFLQTDEQKNILKEIHDMGFAIGNHTYNHQRLSEVDEDTQKQEILELSELIEDIIGETPKFFRAPNGVNTDYAKQFVKDQGMLLMNWTYGYDYFEPYMDAEKLTEAMVTGEAPEVDVNYSLLKPGANLLMHDRKWTSAALEDIVKGLREKGYKMADPNTIKLPE
ncbi:polysaccharide deacetylase family protein [Gracilibacillus sp. YIM 98692]|uniref:polysaccharide deacetylase family protein n=1 Tax=Gracilibacillus sp. YIM 98692 TaxID=2663532 RepID=UPI003204F93D